MTRPTKKLRRKSRRVLMAEAVRRECDPLMFSLGFRNPRTRDLGRWSDISRRNAYIRWRGTSFDGVDFYWFRNRPRFCVEFETSTVKGRSEEGLPAFRQVTNGSMSVWTTPIRGLGSEWFGPWRSIDGVVRLLRHRILQLDHFLQTGERGRWVKVGISHQIGPEDDGRFPSYRKIWGDPWLDPESDYEPGSELKP